MPSRGLGGILSISVILAATSVFVVELIIDSANYAAYSSSASGVFFHYVIPAAITVLLLASLRLAPDLRMSIALSLAAIVPALYGAELTLGLTRSKSEHFGPAANNIDRRTKIQVITDLRAQGIDAYPVMRAKTLLLPTPDGVQIPALTMDGTPFLPLASLPHKKVVSCREGQDWMVYDSDRHGFNNPDAMWDAHPLPMAMVGDSFTHGSCVLPEQNIAAQLRRKHGAVVNLGVSGFGPVSELASIKEYLEPLSPKIVLWLFFEGNDITEDLAFERQSPLLMAYVNDPAFTQRLFWRADDISTHLKSYLDERLIGAMSRFDNPNEKLMEFLTLQNLRERLGLNEVSLGLAETPDFDLFAKTLTLAKRLVGSWGGRLVVVYLPDSARYFAAARNSQTRDHIRMNILKTVHDLNLPLIDVHLAFIAQPDVTALFQYPGSHYSVAGYRTAAEAIDVGLNQ